jgi:hypothetical protein
MGGSSLRKLVPILPDAPVINMRGISSLVPAADLRGLTDDDSKPNRQCPGSTQTQQ